MPLLRTCNSRIMNASGLHRPDHSDPASGMSRTPRPGAQRPRHEVTPDGVEISVHNSSRRADRQSDQRHAQTHAHDPGSSTCHQCLLTFPASEMHVALVPDSSFVHADDPGLDGCRLVRACGPAHLNELIERARDTWVVEQLWFGRLVRASKDPEMRDAPMRQVAGHASLSPERLRQALAWNARRNEPMSSLPGGQALPTRDKEQANEPGPANTRSRGIATAPVPLTPDS